MKVSSFKTDKIIAFLLFSVTLIFLSRYTIFSNTLKWGTWSYAENLISYPSRFLRRGLLGEIILFISGDSPAFEVMQAMVFINCLLLIFMTYILFKLFNLRISQHNILMLSSFGMLYMVYHGTSFNRKEIFAINLFLIYIYLLKKNCNILSFKIKLFLVFSLLFIGLIHEGLLLVTLPFYYLTLKDINKSFSLLYIMSGSLLLVFLLTQQGTEADALEIWNNLSSFDQMLIGNDLKSSAIFALAYSYEKQIIFQSGFDIIQLGQINHWLSILFYFFIYLFLNHFGGSFKNLNNLEGSFFKWEMIYCLPLFIFGGADWGRYLLFFIYIYYFYLLYDFSLTKQDIRSTANTKLIVVFILYSFVTVIPEATYADIDLVKKLANTFNNFYQLFS